MGKFGILFGDFRGVGAVLLVSLLPAWAFDQNTATVPAFDAASVRPGAPDDVRGSTFEFPPGGLKVTNGTLMGIIESAFEVRDFQILGAPGWANSDRYNIVARSASDDPAVKTGDRSAEIKATRQKLQTLLSQRFQLRAHHETRDLPIYALSAGKRGSKLKEGKASDAPAGIQKSCGQMTGTRASMANLTTYLSRELGRPVQDRTGLSGSYDFHVDWMPDSGSCAGSTPDNGDTGAAVSPIGGPSLFTALQEQLGLKLESTKGPVEVVVIDSVEKPDDNQ
jgi:bla regulator protein blaR1